MAKPIEPTPDIETEEELAAFLEYINRPRTEKEKKMFKEAINIYQNSPVKK